MFFFFFQGQAKLIKILYRAPHHNRIKKKKKEPEITCIHEMVRPKTLATKVTLKKVLKYMYKKKNYK